MMTVQSVIEIEDGPNELTNPQIKRLAILVCVDRSGFRPHHFPIDDVGHNPHVALGICEFVIAGDTEAT